MLRLFSNVRKTLINEGKTSRYVRYAVGEVILIMVGILLALQVQTWNEERKLKQERRELIENLKRDFRTTLERLEESINRGSNNMDDISVLLDVSAGENLELSVEETKSLVRSCFQGIYFGPALGSYKAAQTNGMLSLIKDVSLNDLFAEFEEDYSYFKGISTIASENRFLGPTLELRKMLGSESFLTHPRNRNIPPAFALSDQEYRDFISQKKVFAVFETYRHIRGSQTAWLRAMKRDTQQILTALEALD